MARIEEIYIAPFWYRVEYYAGLSGSAGVLGACNTDQQKIIMDPDQGSEVMAETLLHESLHGAWTQTSLDKEFTGDQEESVIFTMSPRIVALLKDNPALVRAVTRKRRS